MEDLKDLQIFSYNSNEVRIFVEDGEPWWVLRDIAEVLEIKRPSDTLTPRLNPKGVDKTSILSNRGGMQETTIINEENLYRALLRSNKANAEPFIAWVTGEVLPTIRKKGTKMNDLVEIKDGKPMAGSLEVAKHFEKEHAHVLRNIKNLECSREFAQSNFGLGSYKDKNNQSRPMYYMTRDGFMFLVMGFTGQKAANVKEEFIAAFNFMEKKLLTQSTDVSQIVRSTVQEMIPAMALAMAQAFKALPQTQAALPAPIEIDYFSIKAYTSKCRIKLVFSEAKRIGKEAVRLSRSKNIQIRKIYDEQFGTVNSYHISVLKEVFTI